MHRLISKPSIPVTLALALSLTACGQQAEAPADEAAEEVASADDPAAVLKNINDDTFGCISDLTSVERFFVGNLVGDVEATVAVASNPEGGVYPVGSVVQLVPTEVMVKREAGFSPETMDWEYFELDATAEGTTIRVRGGAEVNNRFGNSCHDCHVKAEPQFDLICKQDHGCDPIPINDVMIRALQKTDPRCEAQELTAEEAEGLEALQAALGV